MFTQHCVSGMEPNRARITDHLGQSLMLVTALAPHIGYDNAAKVARKAHSEGISLRDAAVALQLLSADDVDRLIRPEAMIGPSAS
jgi:fumarate hydratase class II